MSLMAGKGVKAFLNPVCLFGAFFLEAVFVMASVPDYIPEYTFVGTLFFALSLLLPVIGILVVARNIFLYRAGIAKKVLFVLAILIQLAIIFVLSISRYQILPERLVVVKGFPAANAYVYVFAAGYKEEFSEVKIRTTPLPWMNPLIMLETPADIIKIEMIDGLLYVGDGERFVRFYPDGRRVDF